MSDKVSPDIPISRKELYKSVWSLPFASVAADLGLTVKALASKCNDLKVPYPRLGYWERKQAGLADVVPRLPKLEHDASQAPTKTPRPRMEPMVPPEFENWLDRVRHRLVALRVADELRRPHAIVAKIIRQRGTGDDVDNRGYRILDALLKAVESEGGLVTDKGSSWLAFKAGDAEIEFRLERKFVRYEEPITDLQRRIRAKTGHVSVPEWRKTNDLVVRVKTHLTLSVGKQWSDKPSRPLEKALPRIAEALFICAADKSERRRSLKAHLESRDAERRKKGEQEYAEFRRSRKLEQASQLENERWLTLLACARAAHHSKLVSGYLDALELRGFHEDAIIGDRNLGQWFAWARNRAAEATNLDAAGVFAKVYASPTEGS